MIFRPVEGGEYCGIDRGGVQFRGCGPHWQTEDAAEWCRRHDADWHKPDQFDSPPPRVIHAAFMFVTLRYLFSVRELALRSLAHAYVRLCDRQFNGDRPILCDRTGRSVIQVVQSQASHGQMLMASAVLCVSAHVRDRAEIVMEEIHNEAGDWQPKIGLSSVLQPWNNDADAHASVAARMSEKDYENHSNWLRLDRPSRTLCKEYAECMRFFLQPYLGKWASLTADKFRPVTQVKLPRSYKYRQYLPRIVVQQMEDVVDCLPRRWAYAVCRPDVRIEARRIVENIGLQREAMVLRSVHERADLRSAIEKFDLLSECGYLTPSVQPRAYALGNVTVELTGLNGDTLDDQRKRAAATALAASQVKLLVPSIPN